MKKFLKIVWGIFAVIGILFVAGYVALRLKLGEFDVSINPTSYKPMLGELSTGSARPGPLRRIPSPLR
jgi:hypothetical protein